MKARPFAAVYREAGDIPVGPYASVPGERTHFVAVLLFGAIYVYLLQRTYPPGT